MKLSKGETRHNRKFDADNYPPHCCIYCKHLVDKFTESEYPYYQYSYCGLGLFLPVQKETCKKEEI